ncbi:MAG: hypothetical protein ABI977_05725 [Acidobacteriota bacterium]
MNETSGVGEGDDVFVGFGSSCGKALAVGDGASVGDGDDGVGVDETDVDDAGLGVATIAGVSDFGRRCTHKTIERANAAEAKKNVVKNR